LQYGGSNAPSWAEVIFIARDLHIPFEQAERTTLKWLGRYRAYIRSLPKSNQPAE